MKEARELLFFQVGLFKLTVDKEIKPVCIYCLEKKQKNEQSGTKTELSRNETRHSVMRDN